MGRDRYRNGRDTLEDIDRRAYNMRANIEEFSKNISRIERDLETLDREEAEIYLRLAEVRFDLLDDPGVADKISAAERDAGQLIFARSVAREKLDRDLKNNLNSQKALEKERQLLLFGIEQYHINAEDAEKSSLEKLLKDKKYLEILERVDFKHNQVKRTDDKIELARRDYKEKSEPYHNDELFVYLKERNYGRSDYKASALIGSLDKWVAELVRYEEARRNYDMLVSIPGKLIQHKQLLQKELEAVEQELEDYKQAFYKKDGTLLVQQSLIEKRQEIADLDMKIRRAAVEQDTLLRMKTSSAEQVDENYKSVITTLRNLYKNKSLESLKHYAALSVTQDDDELVSRLISISKRQADQETSLNSYRKTVKDLNNQYQRLEELRAGYKNKGYDSRRVVFRGDNVFAVLLGEFLVGVLTNRQLWHAVGEIIEDVFDD